MVKVVPMFPGPFFQHRLRRNLRTRSCQTKDLAAQLGLGRVYLEHLQKVFEIMQPYQQAVDVLGRYRRQILLNC